MRLRMICSLGEKIWFSSFNLETGFLSDLTQIMFPCCVPYLQWTWLQYFVKNPFWISGFFQQYEL